MTINEKRQLNKYIKGLVRESISEMDSMPLWWNDQYEDGIEKDEDEFWYEHDHPESRRSKYEGPDVEDEIAGISELRRITEAMARKAVKSILREKKESGKAKDKGKKKAGSTEKTLMKRLNDDSINAAHYYYKLYGAKTDAEKAAARSLGYKKAKGEKTPNKKGIYRFTSKERNRLNAMLTTDKN